MRERTIIIAEIGENHLGDLDMARRMVIEAAAAGADIVKFQSYDASDVAERDPEREWFAKVQLSDEMHVELKRLAESRGVEFLSAPFSLERARFLCEELGLRKIKIASSEMLNFPLLDYVARRAEVVFLSTGLAELEEVADALRRLERVPTLYVLHCVTVYPTPDEDANLLAIDALRRRFPHRPVGYSDHTLGIVAPVVAASLGARVIEKHFTLDKMLPGTDHILSATPQELREMVAMVRRVEQQLGSGEKRPAVRELEVRECVRGRFPKSGAGRQVAA